MNPKFIRAWPANEQYAMFRPSGNKVSCQYLEICISGAEERPYILSLLALSGLFFLQTTLSAKLYFFSLDAGDFDFHVIGHSHAIVVSVVVSRWTALAFAIKLLASSHSLHDKVIHNIVEIFKDACNAVENTVLGLGVGVGRVVLLVVHRHDNACRRRRSSTCRQFPLLHSSRKCFGSQSTNGRHGNNLERFHR
jgi:hypothetical protein